MDFVMNVTLKYDLRVSKFVVEAEGIAWNGKYYHEVEYFDNYNQAAYAKEYQIATYC